MRREAQDELGLLDVTPVPGLLSPFFLTWTGTLGQQRHVDVSLRFTSRASVANALDRDPRRRSRHASIA